MKEAQKIVRRPLVTEKSTQQKETANQYAFEVDRRANKVEIQSAVEQLFTLSTFANLAPTNGVSLDIVFENLNIYNLFLHSNIQFYIQALTMKMKSGNAYLQPEDRYLQLPPACLAVFRKHRGTGNFPR